MAAEKVLHLPPPQPVDVLLEAYDRPPAQQAQRGRGVGPKLRGQKVGWPHITMLLEANPILPEKRRGRGISLQTPYSSSACTAHL